MKKYIILIVGALLTIATFISPFVFSLFEPLDMGIVFIIAFTLIGVALVLGSFSRNLVKFLYPFEAVTLFLLSGVTIYKDVFDLRMAQDYGIIILLITFTGVLSGTIIRQTVVAIIRAINKKKSSNISEG